jgi:hypothetical protein
VAAHAGGSFGGSTHAVPICYLPPVFYLAGGAARPLVRAAMHRLGNVLEIRAVSQLQWHTSIDRVLESHDVTLVG